MNAPIVPQPIPPVPSSPSIGRFIWRGIGIGLLLLALTAGMVFGVWKIRQGGGAGTSPVIDLAPNDADRDGLSDEEEKKLGLDEKEFDTDGDGISDADELRVWHTDPKKTDTDGDGISDGMEIVAGINPLAQSK